MKSGRQYPDRWVTGPDPVRHQQYDVFLQQRNQAQWRGEAWCMEFDAWLDLWRPYWPLRGRTRGSYCMTRRDWSLPWTETNVEIITREQHAQHQRWRRESAQVSRARQNLKERE